MVGKPIGDRPLTNAERQQRWRERHAAKLARKQARRGRPHQPFTEDELAALTITWEDFDAMRLVITDGIYDEVAKSERDAEGTF